jgi:hypothetical protein
MNYKTDEYRRYNARAQRRKRALRAQRRELLPDHTRLCIDCRKPFLSRKGMNLCSACEADVWIEAERSTPLRSTDNVVRREQLLTLLYRRYGHKYKASIKPRIPLSEITVFQSTGRKR